MPFFLFLFMHRPFKLLYFAYRLLQVIVRMTGVVNVFCITYFLSNYTLIASFLFFSFYFNHSQRLQVPDFTYIDIYNSLGSSFQSSTSSYQCLSLLLDLLL